MNVARRALIKGMALGSLASVTLASPALGFANAAVGAPNPTARPLLALISGPLAESAFLAGIHAAPQGAPIQVERTDLGLDFILGLQQRLQSGQPLRVIGLVDDASATLIVDLARSSGARVQWLGQHSAAAGTSQHRLLSAEAAHGCAAQLGQRLQRCGQAFSLSEQRLHSSRVPFALKAAAGAGEQSGQWAATLGFALASPGALHPEPALLAANRQLPLSGNFVSFSIET